MKLVQRFTLSFLLALTLPALAQTVEEKLKKTLTQRLGEGTQIETVVKTPYNGLYEVKVGNEIIYSDAEGKFVFIGRILDTETSKDRKSTRLNSSHVKRSRMPSSA